MPAKPRVSDRGFKGRHQTWSCAERARPEAPNREVRLARLGAGRLRPEAGRKRLRAGPATIAFPIPGESNGLRKPVPDNGLFDVSLWRDLTCRTTTSRDHPTRHPKCGPWGREDTFGTHRPTPIAWKARSGARLPGRTETPLNTAKESGAWGRIRTTDTRIFNPLLYQLSYPGEGRRRGSRVYRRGSFGSPARLDQSSPSSSVGVAAPGTT